MRYFAALALLLATPALAQQASDKLPPANPIPYQDTDAQAVLAPVNAMLAAIGRQDPVALLAPTRPGGYATGVGVKADGTRQVQRMSWAELAAGTKPSADRFEERISDPAVEIDGDVAMVWAPYVFLVNGKVTHCGVDHFDLVRENGRWLIQGVTWSMRETGCPAR